ncbi:MAG: alpha/beta fold hydrolase [Alphaproteobacteria bacterium]|nr:alpha/beta fold hydrolase [Alphaproteobacteria bacterium]
MIGIPESFPPFRARFPWWGPDLQTVRNHVLHDYAELKAWPAEAFFFPMESGDRLSASFHRPANDRKLPTVLLIHGFTGCADSAYVLATARHLLESGFPVMRLNLRGAGPTRSACQEMYHAGRSEDVRRVLGDIPRRLTVNGLAAVGFSLGGSVLMKYLGEEGTVTPLDAAISISAPIDLGLATQRINAARNIVYHRWLVSNTKREWLGGPSILDNQQIEAVRRSKTIYTLDDRVVAPLNGFADADDYYAQSSAAQFLDGIKIPTMLIHAANDPWIPVEMYHAVDWSTNDHLMPVITPSGGHVGFHGRGGRWHDRGIVHFLEGLNAEACMPMAAD